MNRSELQQQLINSVIDGMDFKTMWSVLYDYMDESYDKYSDEELKTEVEEYYPELLEDSEEPSEATGWQ
jgi:septin family protein